VLIEGLVAYQSGGACLCVIDEEIATGSTPWVQSPLGDFTTILRTVGGEWVRRVGDIRKGLA
jgi:hypothetical protein